MIEEKNKINSNGRSASKRMFVFLFIIISSILTIFYIDNVFKVNSLMKDIHTISKENQRIRDENTLLRMEINKLTSLERISKIAEEKLGMVRSEKTPIIIYKKDTVK
ncbi:MAG: cell division protein FtsL [Candidatus Kapabacteria bacterium]|nr:cell division protein FtsL [Candidatus Kapabacteria bacterium]